MIRTIIPPPKVMLESLPALSWIPKRKNPRRALHLSIPLVLTLASIFILILKPSETQAAQQRLATRTAPIQSFHLIDQEAGWVLVGNAIFITPDNGATWEEITPNGAGLIRDVQFLDEGSAYLVSESIIDGSIQYSLFSTTDSGHTWNKQAITRNELGKPEAENSNLHLFFLDENHGWIVFRRASSANFNIGSIFRTTDGGITWDDHPIPVGEPVMFISPTAGIVAGGLDGHTLYVTDDGGATWKPSQVQPDNRQTFILPHPGSTAITVASMAQVNGQTIVRFIEPQENKVSWAEIANSTITDHAGAYLPVSRHPAGFSISTSSRMLHFNIHNGDLQEIPRNSSENLNQISFFNFQTGWALTAPELCEDPSEDNCDPNPRLLSTEDGGQTWKRITAPYVPVPENDEVLRKSTRESTALNSRTAFMKGQGFDQCEISSLSNLQAWRYNSPLSAVNLYIGGVSRACPNVNLSEAFVEDLSLQGWKFIPTWVGPQAYCTSFSRPMNSNPTIAFNQGQDNAIDAARIAMKLGLSEPDQSGTVIYYDLEAFNTSDADCLNAAKAFINGWVSKLHEFGVTAGLYGSVCASGLDDMYSIPNPPDVIWPAAWVSSSYNSAIDTYGLPCLSDSQWGDQQRIYQYTGAHWETWGDTSMYVDLDAIDGIVADISRYVGVPTPNLENPSFEDALISPWEIILNSSACTWNLGNDPNTSHSGSQYVAINRTAEQTACFGINQPVALTPQVGDQFRFSVWARSSHPSSPRALTLDIHAEGVSTELSSQKFSGITSEWACLEVAHTISNPGQTSITPAILLEDFDGIDLYLDDAHLSLNTGRLCPNILTPTNLTATDHAANDYIFIDWDQVPFSSYYKIYRKVDPGGAWELLGRTSDDYFLDTTGGYLEEFYYSVKACDAGGCSKSSNSDMGSYSSPFVEFWDGFESGNSDRWNWHENPGNAYLCATANISGDFGLCLNANTDSPALLAHYLVAPSPQVTATFAFDPNSFNPGTDSFVIFALYDSSSTSYPLRLALRESGGNYQIQLIARSSSGGTSSSSWAAIPDQPTQFELNWQADNNQLRTIRSTKGAVLYVNGSEVAAITEIDINGLSVDQVHLGGVQIVGTDPSSGMLFFDNFRYFGPSHLRQSP